MIKKNLLKYLTIIFLVSIIPLKNNMSFSHEDLSILHFKHDPITCKLESDRTRVEKTVCRDKLKRHQMCKLDEYCAILELEKLRTENEDLKDKLGGTATCGDIPFNHKTNKKAKIYQKASSESEVITEVDKGAELLFYAPSTEDESWYYVKVRKESSCSDGYIKQKFVVKKDSDDTVAKVGPKLIEINEPKWAEEGNLILVDAEGTVSISGAVQDGKIDQIIINEEEEMINSDNTFTYLLFVPNSGAEVRIIGNKDGKKVKELIFTVKVGN